MRKILRAFDRKPPKGMEALSLYTRDLLLAEQAYLEATGWEKRGELWWSPEFTVGFTQNYAILVAKTTDQNIGLP